MITKLAEKHTNHCDTAGTKFLLQTLNILIHLQRHRKYNFRNIIGTTPCIWFIEKQMGPDFFWELILVSYSFVLVCKDVLAIVFLASVVVHMCGSLNHTCHQCEFICVVPWITHAIIVNLWVSVIILQCAWSVHSLICSFIFSTALGFFTSTMPTRVLLVILPLSERELDFQFTLLGSVRSFPFHIFTNTHSQHHESNHLSISQGWISWPLSCYTPKYVCCVLFASWTFSSFTGQDISSLYRKQFALEIHKKSM